LSRYGIKKKRNEGREGVSVQSLRVLKKQEKERTNPQNKLLDAESKITPTKRLRIGLQLAWGRKNEARPIRDSKENYKNFSLKFY